MFKRCCYFAGIFIFGLLAIIAFTATVIPLIPTKEWYVRVFDYPRLQTFFISVLALAWYAIFYFKRGRRSFIFVGMFIIVIVVQCYKALPYTPLGHKQVLWSDKNANDSTAISLLICNVLQTNTSYEKVIAKVNKYQPDILVTTESDSIWQKALSVIEFKYPYRVPVPLSNTYGLHLYSKLPLKETSVRFLMEPDIPSIRTRLQLHSGEWITLFLLHPRPPVPGEASDSKERDGEIIMVAKEARKEKGGVIVAGDFNDVAWSATTKLFQQVSGFLDPRRGRGFYCTFNAKMPIFRWPLDHVFHSSHFKLIEMERGANVNSDHFPMFIKLSYEPDEKLSQPKVKPEADTERKANEAIEKGKNDKDATGQ